MIGAPAQNFCDNWRRDKSLAFDLPTNSSSRRTVRFALWGRQVEVYSNANLSIYSAQGCNGACPFCVERLRPASRGITLESQRVVEDDDRRYFAALEEVLRALRPLSPTVSITGGEPSKDARLPDILRLLSRHAARKRTMTTNGSGLLDRRRGRRMIDWVCELGLRHLNVSIAHPDPRHNARLMNLESGLATNDLALIARLARSAGVRVRLSCVLVRDGIRNCDDVRSYLDFARSIDVDNVVFRQLMMTDPQTHSTDDAVVRYSDTQRISLEPLLDQVSCDSDFVFERQVMGYYYYVEVWRFQGMDVVFEEADLAQLERARRHCPEIVHELVFHPNARLASTWQPWDGVLGPPESNCPRD
jgi:molybdenum cofactor biosynthesis enzyme MoaA